MYIYYLIILFVLLALSTLEVKGLPNTAKKVGAVLFTLILISFAGFREAGVGEDDFNYIKTFETVPHIGYWLTGDFSYSFAKVWMEPGYVAYTATIKVFSESYILLFLGVALLSIGLASSQYLKLSPYFFLTLALFFVHTFLYRDINQIRSAVAAAIGLFLIVPVSKRQYIKSVFWVFLAGLFHTAALSYLAVVVASYFKVTKNRLMLLVSFGVVMGALGISSGLLSMLPGMGFITEKLLDYADSGFANSVKLFDITNLKNLFVFFALLLLWDKLIKKVPHFRTMMLFLALGVFWRLAFSDFGIFAARVSTFFSIVEVILIPCMLLAFRERVYVAAFIFIYSFATLYLNLYIKSGRMPYEVSFSLLG